MRTARKNGKLRLFLVVVPILFGWCASSHATGLFSFGDVEKPNPEFIQSGNRIVAKLIPRAKSTSVTVEFEVTEGGTLAGVKGIEFAAVDRPEVDVKNFKSAAFEIAIRDVVQGGTATVAIRSDFFSLSTAFFVFNPKRLEPWIRDAQKENRLLEQRVRELVVQVQDGGDLDADGAADGQIRLVGGPRDSFWGYALGTLFIRFFGIFFVLSLLMIGMFTSGWIFTLFDRIRGGKVSAGEEKKAPAAAASPVESASVGGLGRPTAVPDTVVAAIGAALYLRDTASRMGASPAPPDSSTAWIMQGRQRIMQDRLAAFRHGGRTREE